MLKEMAVHKKNQEGFVHLLTILVVLFSVGLLITSFIPVYRHYSDGKGDVQGVVLARGGDEGESSGGDSSNNLDNSGPGSLNSGPGSVNSGREATRIHPGVAPSLHPEEDEDELEEDADEDDEEIGELEEELEDIGIKVASDAGRIAILRGNFGAISSFPLKVATDSNTLFVTTPSGTKAVTVLPDQAIKHMLASKIMDDIDSAITTGSLASNPNLAKLEERDGILGYKVEGKRIHHFLGIIFLKTHVGAFISAENGEVVSTTQSLLGRILNRIAP